MQNSLNAVMATLIEAKDNPMIFRRLPGRLGHYWSMCCRALSFQQPDVLGALVWSWPHGEGSERILWRSPVL